MKVLGLDIGSNSIGSAWVDTGEKLLVTGVSVFPAGVEDSESKRGAPKNQHRRDKRSQRRGIARRARRKRLLRTVLVQHGLLPTSASEEKELLALNPWQLRQRALEAALRPHEFGRVLLHLAQRRGAFGVECDEDDKDSGKVKQAMQALKDDMAPGETYGQFMARLYEAKKAPGGKKTTTDGKTETTYYHDVIRNRGGEFLYHAQRGLIQEEFNRTWEYQRSLGGPLGELLTDELQRALFDEEGEGAWRTRGAIFGQRRTYWSSNTLERCELEPSDHQCPLGDRHAQEFRVVETLNNVRVIEDGSEARPLDESERSKVLTVLRQQKTAKAATVRKALGWNKKAVKARYVLNMESDPSRVLNTDWFHREVVVGVWGAEAWEALPEKQKESINRALLKFDPASETERKRLEKGAMKWWGLEAGAAEALVAAWRARPNRGNRLKLSRRAICNLLPYLRAGMTVTEARNAFARDPENGATPEQRVRYAFHVDQDLVNVLEAQAGKDRARAVLRLRGTNRRDRQYLEKHPDELPPPPMMANPVVRKAIHEVRRHINAYLRRFGTGPDRIIIEMARETTETAVRRNEALARNRKRNDIRKKLIETYNLESLSKHQQRKALDRLLLCEQQREICPYSGETISLTDAASGNGVEVDHILPRSGGGSNGLGNLILCKRDANRNKSSQTPKQWLLEQSQEGYEAFLQRVAHLKDGPKQGYFSPRELKRKWDNLQRDFTEEDERAWRDSQLTDTAYAARQVGAYLKSALYPDADPAKRVIFFTKGRYTAMLRRDWQLFHDIESMGSDDEAWDRLVEKDRRDHRHHALDAVVIAFSGPWVVEKLGRDAKKQEEEKERLGHWPKREPIPVPKPWTSVKALRRQVVGELYGDGERPGQVVSHRRAKRSLTGALHEETAYGLVSKDGNLFTTRIPLGKLTPKMLRLPEEALDETGRVRLTDPPLGKGGLVRDVGLRRVLRQIFVRNGSDPDSFTKQDVKRLLQAGAFHMPSGVPIKSVKLLRTIGEAVVIESEDHPARIYIGGNNHHMEIWRDERTGKWDGDCVSMFNAARRIRPPRGEPKQPMIKRDHGRGKRFVMSLSEGEIVHARRPDRDEAAKDAVGYFRVAKLDKRRLFFAPHWDARPASEQYRWDCTVGDFGKCGPEPDAPPYKVRVSVLGEVAPVHND